MKNKNGKPAGLFGSVWDERQQQAYHRINSKAMNLIWCLLLAAILVQVALFPTEPLRFMVEIGLFLLVNLYLLVAYLRAGLWTKNRQQPSLWQNLAASLLAAGVITLFGFVRIRGSGDVHTIRLLGLPLSVSLYLLLQAALVFVIAFLALSWLSAVQRKRQQAVEAQLDQEENETPVP